MPTLESHNGLLTCVTLSRDGQTLVSSSGDKTVKVWEFNAGEVKYFGNIYESEEYRIADSFVISTDEKTLDTGIQGGSIYYWDVND